MFRIEFFVDDKHLAEALRGIAGKARNLQVIPVVNVVEDGRNGKSRKMIQDKEHTLGLFLKELKQLNGNEPIDAGVARKALGKIGFSPTSYSHFLNEAVKGGLLKKKKDGNKAIWSWV